MLISVQSIYKLILIAWIDISIGTRIEFDINYLYWSHTICLYVKFKLMYQIFSISKGEQKLIENTQFRMEENKISERVSVSSGQGHKLVNILSIIGVSFCFLLTATFNALSGSGNTTIFNSNVSYIANKYQLDTTPAGWTFSIWVIYYKLKHHELVFLILLQISNSLK